MFKVSLEKELDNKVSEFKKEQNPVKEIQLLLESCESEDRRILQNLSKKSEVARHDKIKSDFMDLENLESEYVGKIYTISQIEDLAISYKLRFLSTQYYTGKFDIELSAKIKEFSKATKTEIDNYTLSTKFFILAPEENFTLKDEKYITKKQLDPVIFYKVDDKHYRMIHKWGNDFSIFRLIKGYSYRNWWTHQITNTVSLLPIFSLIIGFAMSQSDYLYGIGYNLTGAFFSFLLSFVTAYLFWGFGKHDEGEEIKGFFTPHNWNNDRKIIN